MSAPRLAATRLRDLRKVEDRRAEFGRAEVWGPLLRALRRHERAGLVVIERWLATDGERVYVATLTTAGRAALAAGEGAK